MSTAPATASLKGLPNKVPAIALSFWVIKIMRTTVGETGADFLAFSAGLGADLTMALMGALLALALFVQLRTSASHPGSTG